jgi:hypothetical protein
MLSRSASVLCVLALSGCGPQAHDGPRKNHGPRDGEPAPEKAVHKKAKPLNRGECPSEPLPPEFSCGKTGDDATFAGGVDCWLGRCMGELTKVPPEALQLVGPDGAPVPGRVEHDAHVIHFVPEADLPEGSYTLLVHPDQLSRTSDAALTLVNLLSVERDAKFCFKTGDSVPDRNGSTDHGCSG